MPASEAQIAANRKNAARSTGPTSPEGKAASRRNGLKHGLAGSVVVTGPDALDVDERAAELMADLRPRSPLGVIQVRAIAVASVQMERAARHEARAVARNVRHAVDDHDEARHAEATRLFDGLADDPRNNLRRLRRMPEGVERLLEEWGRLRDDLAGEPRPIWTAGHLVRAATMTGLDGDRARNSRLGMISNAFWGDATALGRTVVIDEDAEADHDAEAEARRLGRAALLERIDAEVAALEAHYETLDFEEIELDRADAPGLALFDTSKAATLARRYEAAAQRAYYKALGEFRRVEAEFAERPEPPAPPEPEEDPDPELGSLRHEPSPPEPEAYRTPSEAAKPGASKPRQPEGEAFTVGRPRPAPG